MHEAGLAQSVVAGIRHLELNGRVIRVLISGSHVHGEDSKAALAANIEALVAGSGALIEVVEEPAVRFCSRCAGVFQHTNEQATCPVCGGQPLPSAIDEGEVSVEVVDRIPTGGR